jgi:hypothetical protein
MASRGRQRVEAEVVCPKSHGHAQIALAANKNQLCHKKEPRSYPVYGAWGFVSLLPQLRLLDRAALSGDGEPPGRPNLLKLGSALCMRNGCGATKKPTGFPRSGGRAV